MADQGFPRGGGTNSPGGTPTYDFAKISQKLPEIERIWTPGGGASPKFYYVDPPLLKYSNVFTNANWIQNYNNKGCKVLYVCLSILCWFAVECMISCGSKIVSAVL